VLHEGNLAATLTTAQPTPREVLNYAAGLAATDKERQIWLPDTNTEERAAMSDITTNPVPVKKKS